jgi:hypothetical protein
MRHHARLGDVAMTVKHRVPIRLLQLDAMAECVRKNTIQDGVTQYAVEDGKAVKRSSQVHFDQAEPLRKSPRTSEPLKSSLKRPAAAAAAAGGSAEDPRTPDSIKFVTPPRAPMSLTRLASTEKTKEQLREGLFACFLQSIENVRAALVEIRDVVSRQQERVSRFNDSLISINKKLNEFTKLLDTL